MALSKLDLALVAVAAAGLVWMEHDHRVVIGSLTAAAAPAAAASLCPTTDDAPYSAECIKFIGGGVGPAMLPRGAVRTEPRCLPEGAPDGDSCPGHLSGLNSIPDRY